MKTTLNFFALALFSFLLVTSCNTCQSVDTSASDDDQTQSADSTSAEIPDQPILSLEEFSTMIIELIRDKNYAAISSYVHPEEGIRFSPYAYVEANNLVFSADQILQMDLSDTTQYLWGSSDGTGDPIYLTFAKYHDSFIYDADFANPEEIGLNTVVGQGNTLVNHAEFYPGSEFVEYHFSGFEEKYAGMDWRSLRLIFRSVENHYFLIAIVHDSWTS